MKQSHRLLLPRPPSHMRSLHSAAQLLRTLPVKPCLPRRLCNTEQGRANRSGSLFPPTWATGTVQQGRAKGTCGQRRRRSCCSASRSPTPLLARQQPCLAHRARLAALECLAPSQPHQTAPLAPPASRPGKGGGKMGQAGLASQHGLNRHEAWQLIGLLAAQLSMPSCPATLNHSQRCSLHTAFRQKLTGCAASRCAASICMLL